MLFRSRRYIRISHEYVTQMHSFSVILNWYVGHRPHHDLTTGISASKACISHHARSCKYSPEDSFTENHQFRQGRIRRRCQPCRNYCDQPQQAMQHVLEEELQRAAVGSKNFSSSPYVTMLKPCEVLFSIAVDRKSVV